MSGQAKGCGGREETAWQSPLFSLGQRERGTEGQRGSCSDRGLGLSGLVNAVPTPTPCPLLAAAPTLTPP